VKSAFVSVSYCRRDWSASREVLSTEMLRHLIFL
jgi:hypothetical protein